MTWRDIMDLGDPHRRVHEQQLEKLKEKIVDNIDETGEWFAVPNPATLEALQVPRVAAARARAETDLSADLDGSLNATIQKFDSDSAAIADQAQDQYRAELQALIVQKRNGLLTAMQAPAERDEARKFLEAAQKDWAARIETSYRSALLDKLEKVRSKLLPEIMRDRTAAYWIKKLLIDGKCVPHAELGSEYQKSDQHLQDQLINTVTLMALEDGSLVYRARGRDAGGRFSFETNYMDESPEFRKQAQYRPPDPQVRGPEDRNLPFALRFLDQVQMPVMSSASLKQVVFFNLRKGDTIERVLRQIEGDVLAVLDDAGENRYGDRPEIENFPGTARISDWLDKDPARQISVALRPDGLLAVVVKLNESKTTIAGDIPDEVIQLREDYNNARLMSLLIVALVTRVLNGSDGARGFPKKLDQSKRLHIPSFCIWPLQVDPNGAVTRAETLLEQFKSGALKLDKVPRWAVGWSPTVQANALASRFTFTAEQHLRVLNATDAGPIEVRKGVNENDALEKLTQWFKYTCLLLGALWAAMVLSTVVAANAYSVKELWITTLAFSIIGIWRCLICWGLSARAREPRPSARRNGRLSRMVSAFSKFVGIVVERAFARRWFLLTGPGIICLLMAATFVESNWAEVVTWVQNKTGFVRPLIDMLKSFAVWTGSLLAGLKPDFIDLNSLLPEWLTNNNDEKLGRNSPNASGFQTALYNGVWALPLLAIGLMRHGYMLLYDLVLQRGQLQRKLNSVVGVEETWAAGQALPSLMTSSNGEAPALSVEKTAAIGNALAQMKTRVKNELATARSRFDKGSAANAALVAVIGLLAPFDAMKASTLNKPSKPNIYEGLSTELEKTHDNLVAKLGPLIPEYPPVNQIEVAPEVLADLGKLNAELSAVLETLQNIQNNPGVTISAQTGDARRQLSELATQLDRLQPESLVIGANTESAEAALRLLEQRVAHTRLPQLLVEVQTENAISALNDLSRAMRQVTMNSKLTLDADIGAALQELGFLKAVLDQLREGMIIPVTLESEKLLETAPWIDVDLAFINAATYPEIAPGIWSRVLEQCDQLGGMRFDTNDANVNNGEWFSGRDVAGKTDLASLVARLKPANNAQGAPADGPWRIYILGLADTQGNAVSNLNLSKRRAEAVKEMLLEEVDQLPVVTLPLGEAGWLADTGLPDRESDANHRSATVYLCPQQIQFADHNGGGDRQ
ncbi:hypothetical protein [Ruegeria sp. Ofav3-42]|uniref:hypothetical protein n=1 Tax=Ruegeria sp. Ofav3-42 TaxID=2917759 RepID=UPI001EF5BDF4|nr:hypothetical protein [Ruegeria sp. Ofav3-42]MCG7519505.1 hypothetical protein [Ruegeria sp. Ofav3-42]